MIWYFFWPPTGFIPVGGKRFSKKTPVSQLSSPPAQGRWDRNCAKSFSWSYLGLTCLLPVSYLVSCVSYLHSTQQALLRQTFAPIFSSDMALTAKKSTSNLAVTHFILAHGAGARICVRDIVIKKTPSPDKAGGYVLNKRSISNGKCLCPDRFTQQ